MMVCCGLSLVGRSVNNDMLGAINSLESSS